MSMRDAWRYGRRYFETVRYLRAIQWYYRLRNPIVRRCDPWLFPLLRARAGEAARFGTVHEGQSLEPLRPVARTPAGVQAILDGRYTFANIEKPGDPLPHWQDDDRFWAYNLHYFDYGPVLAQAYLDTGDARYRDRVMELTTDWIAKNPVGRAPGWDGGPLSHRLVNWCYLHTLCTPEAGYDAAWYVQLASSAFDQALYLSYHLEHHLGANHLLTNAKALLIAGLALAGPAAERWRNTGLGLLRRELARQILADGGHYERAPMYHLHMLKDVLEAAQWLRARGMRDAEIESHAVTMLRFMARTLHPDGEIPLFNDSVLRYAPSPDELRAFAAEELELDSDADSDAEFDALPESGLFVFRPARDTALIADFGPVGPDDNPGHAHSDTLGFEASVDGRRMLVDAGVYHYGRSAWRAYGHSTAAHNTVQVDEAEATEKWGPWYFRAGRRARPIGVAYEAGPPASVSGGHDGFRFLPGAPEPWRRIVQTDNGCWVVHDVVRGRGEHRVDTHLHPHPACRIAHNADGSWTLTRDDAMLHAFPYGPGDYARIPSSDSPAFGWYFPEFNRRISYDVLVRTQRATLPVACGVVLIFGALTETPTIAYDARNAVLTIAIGDVVSRVDLQPRAR